MESQEQELETQNSTEIEEVSHVVLYPESSDLRMVTFSYLPGCILFHKIALTCKSIRKLMPESGLLDQIKVVTIKAPTDNYPDRLPLESFKYALSLADSI
jgi:hypothetical protein